MRKLLPSLLLALALAASPVALKLTGKTLLLTDGSGRFAPAVVPTVVTACAAHPFGGGTVPCAGGGGGGGTPTWVQGCHTPSTGSTFGPTIACTFGAAITSPDAVVCWITNDTSVGTVASVADDKTNSYTIPATGGSVNDTTHQQSLTVAYALNLTNAPTTITVTFSASETFRGISCDEFSHVLTAGAVDGNTMQWLTAPGSGADAITSGNITTTASGDLIVGGVVISSGTATITSGANFTIRENDATASESLVQSSAGAIAATFTENANQPAIVGVLALKHN